jgi:uncharacterized damage-inducible protein DinB
MPAEQEFLQFSAAKLRQQGERIATCLQKLKDDQIWLRGSENENAVGNLCLHLAGNLRQWIGAGVAGLEDVRDRDREFSARGGKSRADLQALLATAVEQAASIIEQLQPHDLVRRTRVQVYDLTILAVIYHVVEHFSQHTGQILFATKAFTGEDMGFYAHLSKAKQQGTEQPRAHKTP